MTNILPVHSKDGHTYWVEEGDTMYIERLRHGQYQKTNWKFAQTLIDNWSRAIDVGTNNACNAIHYAKKFAQVECFEPTPLAQQLWTNTIRDNAVSNAILYKNAVGEMNKSVEMLEHPRNGGHNHIRATTRDTIKNVYTVQVETLDSYCFQDVGFIKIDVEGYEKFVLEGAQQTIQRCRPTLQLEIVANQCRKFGYWGEDMIEWIRSLDYTVVSKNRGNLYGKFSSHQTELRYEGVKYRGEMDLWFQPNERVRQTQTEKLFEIEHG
jgi:FkbM family methyltransferase